MPIFNHDRTRRRGRRSQVNLRIAARAKEDFAGCICMVVMTSLWLINMVWHVMLIRLQRILISCSSIQLLKLGSSGTVICIFYLHRCSTTPLIFRWQGGLLNKNKRSGTG